MNLDQFKKDDGTSHLWIKCSSDSERKELLEMFYKLDSGEYKYHSTFINNDAYNGLVSIKTNNLHLSNSNYSGNTVVTEIEFKAFKFRLRGFDSILEDIDKLELKNMNLFDTITQNSNYHLELRFLLTPVAIRTIHVKGVDVKMVYIFGIRVYRQGL